MKTSHDTTETLRVLCVDDNHDVADSTVMLLTVLGHQAQACYSGQEALEVARTFRPDVVLTDIEMPGLSGWELTRALLRAGLAGVVIAATARNDAEAIHFSQSVGCARHLTKPVDPVQLVRTLQDVGSTECVSRTRA
jgi:CheY-like chemotaxis protein